MMRLLIFGLLFVSLVSAGPALATEADAVVGEWYTKDNKALVKIYKQDDAYNGKIIWLKEPKNEDCSYPA